MKHLTGRISKTRYYFSSESLLGKGGEGSVYDIENTGLCLKLYDKNKSFYEEKITYMCDNPPFDKNCTSLENQTIIWPIEPVEDSVGNFMGFVMKKVVNSCDLSALSTLKIGQALLNKHPWLSKFKSNQKDYYFKRMAIAHNIASAMELIHRSGKYVLCDCKAQNIKLTPNGHVYIIDMDSIQIKDNFKNAYFNAMATSEEIMPPEGFNRKFNIKENFVKTDWDVFSFASIIYTLICGGPAYTGQLKSFYHSDGSMSSMVKRKLLPVGRKRKKFRVIPGYHNRFFNLPQDIKGLFLNTFERTNRPSITEWCNAIKRELYMVQCGESDPDMRVDKNFVKRAPQKKLAIYKLLTNANNHIIKFKEFRFNKRTILIGAAIIVLSGFLIISGILNTYLLLGMNNYLMNAEDHNNISIFYRLMLPFFLVFISRLIFKKKLNVILKNYPIYIIVLSLPLVYGFFNWLPELLVAASLMFVLYFVVISGELFEFPVLQQTLVAYAVIRSILFLTTMFKYIPWTFGLLDHLLFTTLLYLLVISGRKNTWDYNKKLDELNNIRYQKIWSSI